MDSVISTSCYVMEFAEIVNKNEIPKYGYNRGLLTWQLFVTIVWFSCTPHNFPCPIYNFDQSIIIHHRDDLANAIRTIFYYCNEIIIFRIESVHSFSLYVVIGIFLIYTFQVTRSSISKNISIYKLKKWYRLNNEPLEEQPNIKLINKNSKWFWLLSFHFIFSHIFSYWIYLANFLILYFF